MIKSIDYKYMQYLGIDKRLIRQLKNATSDKQRKVIDRELQDLMSAPKRNHD